MSVAQRYLMFSISTLLTIIVVSAGIGLYNKISPYFTATNQKVMAQTKLATEAPFMAYDNQIGNGSTVYTAMRQFSNQNNFYLYIQTNNGTVRNFGTSPMGLVTSCQNFDYTAGQLSTGTGTCNVSESAMEDNTSIYYVSPVARFKSTVVRDTNKRIYAIYFQMQ